MHEWSVTQSIVEALLRFAEENGLRNITRVVIEVNQLSQLENDIIKEAFQILTRGTIAEDAELVIDEAPVSFVCRNCGYRWGLEDVLREINDAAKTHGIVDEEGTVDPPLHYLPMLVYSFVKCPRCGSRDFEIENPYSVRIKNVEGEK